MAIPTLSGSYIDETYGRLVQVSGSEYADGLGNPISFLGGAGGPINSIQINSDGSNFTGYSALTFINNTLSLTGSSIVSGSTTIIGNQYITGSIYIPNNAHSIYFSGSSPVGRLVWNDDEGTLDLGLKGGNATLQIGQESVVRVVNKTGADLLESQYKVVRVRRIEEGGAQGQRLAVVLAQGNNDANSVDTLGIVTENIANNEEGFITTSGIVRGINTTSTGPYGENWQDGDVLYLSSTTAGALTKIRPDAPDHTVVMGYVIYAHQNNGKIFVKVDNGYEIDELHNVLINTGSLSSGDLLVRSGSVWINSKSLSGSYSVTGSLTVSGSSTFTNIGPAVFSGSVTSTSGFTGSFSGSYIGDGSSLSGLPSQVGGNANEIQYNSGGTFGGISQLTYDGVSLVTATNIKATGIFAEKMTTTIVGNTSPATPDLPVNLDITETGTYIISSVLTGETGYITFPDPSLYVGQKIRIQNRDADTANIYDNGNLPKDIDTNDITEILGKTTKTFIAGERSADAYSWLEI